LAQRDAVGVGPQLVQIHRTDLARRSQWKGHPGRRRYGDDQRRQRNVWAFTFQRDGSLTGNRLLIQFPDFGMDGMRCDVDGAFTSPAAARVRWPWFRRGKVLQDVDVLGKMPNQCGIEPGVPAPLPSHRGIEWAPVEAV